MATRQPGQAGVTIDQLGYLRHADDPFPTKTNDTGDAGVAPPIGVGGVAVAAQTGGTLIASLTVSYKITAITAAGESLPSAAFGTATIAGTSTNMVTLTWVKVPGATGYKIYGRTSGTWLLMATLGDVATWIDTGAVTPSGAINAVNTSGNLAAGVEPGAVLGATHAAAIGRPTVDTRNATNVGAPTGPDTEAPREWS